MKWFHWLHGEFIGGEFSGLNVVTKGGIGDKFSLNQCIHYLKENSFNYVIRH